ncbi:MAG: hypothetical protein RIS76_2321 [Verrucomicrobiota bacterium]
MRREGLYSAGLARIRLQVKEGALERLSGKPGRPQGQVSTEVYNAGPIYWAAVNAIQELNAKVEGKNSEIAALRAQNRSMEQRLAAREKLLAPQVDTAVLGGGR